MIWFNVKEAYDYLTINGEVFSLRPHKKKRIGNMMLLSSLQGEPYYKGIVNVQFLREINLDNPISKSMLLNYVGKSGFQKIEQWLSKVKESKILYLYWIKVIKLV